MDLTYWYLLCLLIGPSYFVIFSMASSLLNVGGFSGESDLEESDFSAELSEAEGVDLDMGAEDLSIEPSDIGTEFGDDHSVTEPEDNVELDTGTGDTGYKANFYSLRHWTISLFGFGVGGITGKELLEWNEVQSFFLAASLGFFVWITIFLGITFLYNISTYNYKTPYLLRRRAKVILSIPPDQGVGLVELCINGEMRTYQAKTTGEKDIPSGSMVKIIKTELERRLVFVQEINN